MSQNVRIYSRTVKRGENEGRTYNIQIRVDYTRLLEAPVEFLDDAFASKWITTQGQLRKAPKEELELLEREGLSVKLEELGAKRSGPKLNIGDAIAKMAKDLEESLGLSSNEAIEMATRVVMASIR